MIPLLGPREHSPIDVAHAMDNHSEQFPGTVLQFGFGDRHHPFASIGPSSGHDIFSNCHRDAHAHDLAPGRHHHQELQTPATHSTSDNDVHGLAQVQTEN